MVQARRPAIIQEMWWDWVRGLERQLSHERLHLLIPVACREPDRIEAAIRAVVARHPTLSSHLFDTRAGLGLGLRDASELPIATVHLGDEVALRSAWTAACARDLRIDDEWLFRPTVFMLDEGATNHVGINLHHAVFDGRSRELFESELRSTLSGETMVDVASDYIDYSDAERAWLEGEGAVALAAQRAALGAADPLRLRSSGAELTWKPGRKTFYNARLAGSALDDLQAAAAALECSPSRVWFALMARAVARWSGQEDFLLRIVGDMRTTSAPKAIIGNLVCTDLVPLSVRERAPFEDLVHDSMASHRAATRIRVPNLLGLPGAARYPDLSRDAVGRKSGVTVNYMPRPRPARDAKAVAADQPLAFVRNADEEFWPAPVSPVNCRINDWGEWVDVQLEFTNEVIDRSDQARLVELISAGVGEIAAEAVRRPAPALS